MAWWSAHCIGGPEGSLTHVWVDRMQDNTNSCSISSRKCSKRYKTLLYDACDSYDGSSKELYVDDVVGCCHRITKQKRNAFFEITEVRHKKLKFKINLCSTHTSRVWKGLDILLWPSTQPSRPASCSGPCNTQYKRCTNFWLANPSYSFRQTFFFQRKAKQQMCSLWNNLKFRVAGYQVSVVIEMQWIQFDAPNAISK